VDYSAKAVQHCQRLYAGQGNLKFAEGNAMALPFDDSSFDVIYNVESSHCYSDMGAFVKEVHRVLRSGGLFAWTDFRDGPRMTEIHDIFLNAGFGIVDHSDITAEVLNALDEISDDKQARIKNGTSKVVRRSFETFAGVRGTPVYESFQNGSLGYHRYLLSK
jgi:ubiquinone/menaquinone biosynthesis C-methylase UbiE